MSSVAAVLSMVLDIMSSNWFRASLDECSQLTHSK